MTGRLYRSLIACWLMLIACAVSAAGADRGMIWRIDGPGVSAYLVGSMHVARPDLYPLPERITEAFGQSQGLVVEADIVDIEAQQLLRLISEVGTYPSDDSLEAHLAPQAWQRLSQALRRFGIRPELVAQQRPWLAQITLASAAMRADGYLDSRGLDRHFLTMAHDRNLPIRELESVPGQLRLLAGMDEEQQLRLLDSAVDQVLRGQLPLQAMEQAWRTGDVAALQRLIDRDFPPQLTEARNLLLNQRNEAMAEKIGHWLGDGDRLFIVVGAAHMVGDDGLPALLRARGFSVEQL